MCISSQIIESNLVKYNDVDKENREKVVWKRVDWIRKKSVDVLIWTLLRKIIIYKQAMDD